MRQKFVVGNWKMHTTTAEARQLARAVVDGVGIEDRVSVAICPPFPYLALVGEILKGSRVALGAQNLYPEKEGAFTGEVSPTMLLDLGCKYVILGHSERRHKLGESDAFINQKVRVALAAGLDVILCVGETLDQREADQTEAVLDRQLSQGLAGLSADTLTRLTIAYEPVWAIGSSGHHATPSRLRRRTPSFGAASVRCSMRNRLRRLPSSTAAASSRRTPPRCLADLAWTAPSSAAPACTPTSFWPSSGLGFGEPQTASQTAV